MKRHRAKNAYFDSIDDDATPPKRKAAATDATSAYNEEFEWLGTPSQPFSSRADFSPPPFVRPTGPHLVYRAIPNLSSSPSNDSTLLPPSLQTPICCTPEELKSPTLRIPPPRPQKHSSSLSSPTSVAHTPPTLETIPLQELVTKIRIRPSALRKISSTSSQKVPNRPKPQLKKYQSACQIQISRSPQRDSENRRQGSSLGQTRQQASEFMHFVPPTALPPSIRISSSDSTIHHSSHVIPSESRDQAKAVLSVDPSIKKGMFHQATLSKLHVRSGNSVQARMVTSKADEWVDSPSYNPYNLVSSNSTVRAANSSIVSYDPHLQLTNAPESQIEQRSEPLVSQSDQKKIEALNDSRDHPFELDDDEDEVNEDALEEIEIQSEYQQTQETPNWEQRAVSSYSSDFGLESVSDLYSHSDLIEYEPMPSENDQHAELEAHREAIFAMEMDPVIEYAPTTPFERRLREPGPSAW